MGRGGELAPERGGGEVNPEPSTLNTHLSTLDTQHSTLNFPHSTLITQHSTLNTQHSILKPNLSTQHARGVGVGALAI